ncbi:MAG: anti-sigma factor family protein [Candidatus Methylomirabilales bacterium]
MATAVAEELDPAEILQGHLSQCPNCRAEYEEWRQTWALLTSWADVEPARRLDRVILAEASARAETSPSWLRRLASGRVWAAAAGAAVLAVMVSLLLPYQDALRLCGKAFTGAGLAAPVVPLSFLVGAVYALLPLLVAVPPWMRLKGDGQAMQGITVGQAFAVIMVPYILFTCISFEATVLASILMGTVTGALGGGALSQLLVRHQHPGLPV